LPFQDPLSEAVYTVDDISDLVIGHSVVHRNGKLRFAYFFSSGKISLFISEIFISLLQVDRYRIMLVGSDPGLVQVFFEFFSSAAFYAEYVPDRFRPLRD
jgi:hypothetical protein